MPIHNAAYRNWSGPRVRWWTRWTTIASMEIKRASKSKQLKRLLFAVLFPLLFFGVPFFLFEQSTREPGTWQIFSRFALSMPQASILRESIAAKELGVDLGENVQQGRRRFPRNLWMAPAKDPTPEQYDAIRHEVWSFMLLTFMRYPQSILMVLVVGIVAPPLISQDLRTRAYLIYFARPITRLEYIVGKFGAVGFFLLCISAVPALLLYVVGVFLSPSLTVVLSTWDLPIRILVGAACLIVPTTLVALAFSSLTLESRYAGFAWFAMWIVGHVTYSSLVAIPAWEATQDGSVFEPGWRLLMSPYQVLGIAQAYIFGFTVDDSMILPAFLLLGVASIVSLIILFRRVAAPMYV